MGGLNQMNKSLPGIPAYIEHLVVDEETLLKAKEIEDRSIFFHSEDKGCKISEQVIYSKFARKYITVQHCETHRVDCCRCGWEFGYHYHTRSKFLSNHAPMNLRESSVPCCKIICQRCGKEATAHRSSGKYCSDCKAKARKEQAKTYRITHTKKGGNHELDVPENQEKDDCKKASLQNS